MKKNHSKDNRRCDGMRDDGTCGNGYCGNHNKKCRGVNCPDRFQYNDGEGAVATKRPSTINYKDRVSGQYAAIETAKDNLLRECVKFGALLIEVGYYLGESQGYKGEGLKAWLAENCPQINYNTAMGYKRMGEMAVAQLGGGSQAVAVLQDKTEVVPPGEDAPIDVESKFVDKRDKLFSEVKSRRELEQTYFKFMTMEGKGKVGRPKGTGVGAVDLRKARTAEEKAADAEHEMRELIGKLGAFLTRGGKVNMLSDAAMSDFHRSLVDYAAALAEMM